MVLPRYTRLLSKNGAAAAPSGERERIGADPIFVDELERFAADVRDPRCGAIAERLAAPLRVAVSGRAGVGRSTVARALTHAGTLAVTTTSDAELDVYVIAEVVKPEDRAAIGAAGRPVLTVLTKADLIAATDAGRHPQGPTSAARIHCEQLSARTGLPIEPLVGRLAVAALNDEVDDALWSGLQALADEHPVAASLQRRLVETLDVFGIAQAIAAIRFGATRAETITLLKRLSCIDEVVAAIEVARGAGALPARPGRRRRPGECSLSADPLIGEFLSCDDTVVARMMAAVDAVEAGGMTVDRGTTADAHLRRAADWRHNQSGVHRACSADIVRGSLRTVDPGRRDGVTDEPGDDVVAEVDAMVAAIGPRLGEPSINRVDAVLVTGPWLSGVSAVVAALTEQLPEQRFVESTDLAAGEVPTLVVFVVSAAAALTESDCALLDAAMPETDRSDRGGVQDRRAPELGRGAGRQPRDAGRPRAALPRRAVGGRRRRAGGRRTAGRRPGRRGLRPACG